MVGWEILIAKFFPRKREPFCFYIYYWTFFQCWPLSHSSSTIIGLQTSSNPAGDVLVAGSLGETTFYPWSCSSILKQFYSLLTSLSTSFCAQW